MFFRRPLPERRLAVRRISLTLILFTGQDWVLTAASDQAYAD